jgi:hypothetical protein
MYRRTLALSTTIALGIASLVGVADATRTVKIASHLSIKSRGLTFSGHVTSKNAACKDARHVTLYRKFSDGTHQALGSTTTGSSGHWQITPPGSAGISLSHFFATVKRRSEGAAGTIYVCKGAHSKTIPLHP